MKMRDIILKAGDWGRRAALAAIILFAGTNRGWANGGYFVTYNSEVEKGELELMLMNDFTSPSAARGEREGFGQYWSHMLELEYGVSDRYATEFMVESFEDPVKHRAVFTGYRWENRYRLFKERVPLNPMVYAEYENLDPRTRYKMEVSGWIKPPYKEKEGESGRERILETRFIFSDKAGPLDIAFNWINESDLVSGETAFGYSLGLMWMMQPENDQRTAEAPGAAYTCPMHHDVHEAKPGVCPHCGMSLVSSGPSSESRHGVGLGLELYGGLGDTRSFGLSPSRQEHYFGPIFMYHINSRWMAHVQLANGLSHASDNLVRFNIGYEF